MDRRKNSNYLDERIQKLGTDKEEELRRSEGEWEARNRWRNLVRSPSRRSRPGLTAAAIWNGDGGKPVIDGKTSFACFGCPGRRIEKYGTKWPFGRPPSAGGRPNFHFVPYFSMRRPGQPKHAKLVRGHHILVQKPATRQGHMPTDFRDKLTRSLTQN